MKFKKKKVSFYSPFLLLSKNFTSEIINFSKKMFMWHFVDLSFQECNVFIEWPLVRPRIMMFGS